MQLLIMFIIFSETFYLAIWTYYVSYVIGLSSKYKVFRTEELQPHTMLSFKRMYWANY